METITYNEAYTRLCLLEDMRALTLPAKTLAEVLILRAAYRKPIAAWSQLTESINTDEQADDEARAKAIEAAANEDSGAANRVLSTAAFTDVVEAGMTKGMVKSNLCPDKELNAADWLDVLSGHLI